MSFTKTTEKSHGVKLGVCLKLTGPHTANRQPGKLGMQYSLPWHGKEHQMWDCDRTDIVKVYI